MVLKYDGTPATSRTESTIKIAIKAGAILARKLSKVGRAKRAKTVMTPVAQPASLWLATCSGQRVSMDQIGSVFGRE